jgi:putative ABC transport system permease protein
VVTSWLSIRHSLRLLGRNPGFTTAATLTLGLAIAVNCAVFSILNSILLQALPYPAAGRIVAVWQSNTQRGLSQQLVSVPDYAEWKMPSGPFEAMAAWNFQYFNLTGLDRPERVEGLKVTADFFRVLGVHAAWGRTFLPEEDQPKRDHVAVLSEALWRRRFGGDPAILGRNVMIEGTTYMVVGVLPARFRLFRVLNRSLDLYLPYALDPARASRTDHLLFVYAQLKPGVPIQQAHAALEAIATDTARRHPDTSRGWSAQVVDLQEQWTAQIRPVLLMVQAAVGLVLLIACANVASLLLARAVGRQREMAIRAALGAGRLRLVRLMLAESSVLGILAGVVGTGLAVALIRLLNELPYTVVNRVEPFRLDARVLAFSLGIAFLAGVVVGVAPALQCSPAKIKTDVLRGRRSLRVLVTGEVALAVVLLSAAGVLVRSSAHVTRMARGLDHHNVLTAQLWLPPAHYAADSQIAQFWRNAVGRVSKLPGVESASAVNFPPLSVLSTSVGIHVEGASLPRPGEEPQVQYWIVTPDYLRTVRIPILEGRGFTEHDDADAPGAVVVSAAMAHRFWPGQSAVGKRIRTEFPQNPGYWLPRSKTGWLAIVGVAGDVRLDGVITNPPPQMYLPYSQNPASILHLVVRTAGAPLQWSPDIRIAIQSLDQDQPVFDVKSLDEVLEDSITRASVLTEVLGAFAALALLLATIGISSVVAYLVSQQDREIGIRMAVGADPAHVVRMVLRQGMGAVLVGMAGGAAGALGATRLLKNLLVGVGSSDPVAFVAALSILLGAAGLATYIPARRAARVDPISALRSL